MFVCYMLYIIYYMHLISYYLETKNTLLQYNHICFDIQTYLNLRMQHIFSKLALTIVWLQALILTVLVQECLTHQKWLNQRKAYLRLTSKIFLLVLLSDIYFYKGYESQKVSKIVNLSQRRLERATGSNSSISRCLTELITLDK